MEDSREDWNSDWQRQMEENSTEQTEGHSLLEWKWKWQLLERKQVLVTHMDSQTEPIMDVGYKHRSTQTRMIFTFSETSRGRRDAMDSVGLILP